MDWLAVGRLFCKLLHVLALRASTVYVLESSMPYPQPHEPRSKMLIAKPAPTSLLAPASYDYDGRRPPMIDTSIVSVQPPAQTYLLVPPAPPDPNALFPCDEPALINQYMANYPPLQPERVMGYQPTASREEMVYPDHAETAVCQGDPINSFHASSGSGLQPSGYSIEVSVQAYAADGDTSPYYGQGMAMNLPAHFHSAQSCDVRLTGGDSVVQDGSAASDPFPPQKASPVRRGPFKDQDSREKTALTRKMGSCIRCRMQRIRVSTCCRPHSLTTRWDTDTLAQVQS